MSTIRDSLPGRASRRRVRVPVWLSLALALVGSAAFGSVLAYPRLASEADDPPILNDGHPLAVPTVEQSSSTIELPLMTIAATPVRTRQGDRLPTHSQGSRRAVLVPCSQWRPLHVGSGYVQDLCRPGAVSQQQAKLLSLKSPPPLPL